MPGDKVENKAANTEDNSGSFLSDLALDLLKGYQKIQKVETTIAAGIFGGAAGAAGVGLAEAAVLGAGAGVGAAAAKAAEAAVKANLETVHKHRDNPILNTMIPGFGFWERAAETTVNNVVDHVKENPVRAGVEMLFPPLLVFDANLRKLWGN
jgi:hypothetical protein